jgi:dual specificity MAP kinase phosphatase
VEAKYEERLARIRGSEALTEEEVREREEDLVMYNVFVMDASPQEMEEVLEHLVIRTEDEEDDDEHHHHHHGALASTLASAAGQAEGAAVSERRKKKANTISFAQREKDEMRELTRASEIATVFPALSALDEHGPENEKEREKEREKTRDAFSGSTTASRWDASLGQIFLGNSNDVPMPPAEYCPLPRSRASTPPAEDDDPFNCASNDPARGFGYDICVECHDAAPFPSSAHLRAAEEHVNALEEMWAQRCAKDGTTAKAKAVRPPPNANSVVHLPFPSSPPSTSVTLSALLPFLAMLERLLAPVEGGAPAEPTPRPRANSGSLSSLFSPAPSSSSPPPPRHRSRPVKVLIYSSDGYTESSVLALSCLMYLRVLALPEAYLELQVAKRRSFFVYASDVGVLKRIEQRVARERGAMGAQAARSAAGWGFVSVGEAARQAQTQARTIGYAGRPGSNSVSVSRPPAHAQTMGPASVAAESPLRAMVAGGGRPRATTSPMLPSLFDGHQAWFDDPRFDGSFPSRVLPFLYLGNL